MIASSAIVVSGIIRLGYFNVMEQNRQKSTSANRKSYQGLPVTSVAVILPLVYLCKKLIVNTFSVSVFNMTFTTIVLMVALFFILDFKVKKPNNKEVIFMMLFALLIILGLVFL